MTRSRLLRAVGDNRYLWSGRCAGFVFQERCGGIMRLFLPVDFAHF